MRGIKEVVVELAGEEVVMMVESEKGDGGKRRKIKE